MPILVLQWMGVALAGILGIKYAPALLGIDLFGPGKGTPDTPGNTSGNSTTTGDKPPEPSMASIAKDIASNPISVLGVAAILFGVAIAIKQLRGAGIEAGSAAKTTYGEVNKVGDSPKIGKRA